MSDTLTPTPTPTPTEGTLTKIENTVKSDIPKVVSFWHKSEAWLKANPAKAYILLGFVFGFIIGTIL